MLLKYSNGTHHSMFILVYEGGGFNISFTGAVKRISLHYDTWGKVDFMYFNNIELF